MGKSQGLMTSCENGMESQNISQGNMDVQQKQPTMQQPTGTDSEQPTGTGVKQAIRQQPTVTDYEAQAHAAPHSHAVLASHSPNASHAVLMQRHQLITVWK